MNELERLFAKKKTENLDDAYNTTGNKLLDILFMTNYFENNLDEVKIGDSEKEKTFARFIRDPRYGIGRRDLGRELMKQAKVKPKDIAQSGSFDDLVYNATTEVLDYIRFEAVNGNHLAKKWLPRLTGKDGYKAKALCRIWGITEKQYRKLIKTTTTERLLTENRTEEIEFDKVPSLSMIKYWSRFATKEDTKYRFEKYLEAVKKGDAKINISTTNVYDIYKNRGNIDADLVFDKLEKISINCLPIIDTSGSMADSVDSMGKAMSIGHYLAKCSTYYKDYVILFSSEPHLIKLGSKSSNRSWYSPEWFSIFKPFFDLSTQYGRELNSIYTGDVTNTDFGKVLNLLKGLKEFPEYLVVLTDMEFDDGSNQSKQELQRIWADNNCKTKIVWWNFNTRNKTVPELDEMGNIFISGYSPYLLKYLEAGFDGEQFLDKLLKEYIDNLNRK